MGFKRGRTGKWLANYLTMKTNERITKKGLVKS